MLNKHGQEFVKLLERIRPSKSKYEVFNDWLVMAAAALYAWKQDENTEKEYLEIVKQYKPDEVDQLGQLLEITVNALEEKEHDFLGEVFTFAGLTNSKTGQFFTPYNVSLMMAKMMIGENGFPHNRVCKITDPCSGAGGMLVAAVSVMKDLGFNFQQNALFVAEDIDARCARMTYIQLSLLGVPAIIICGNSLTLDTYWQRETIGYYMAGMEYRLRIEAVLDNEKELDQAALAQIEEKPVEIKLPRMELFQGELF